MEANEAIALVKNELEETRQPEARIGIRIGAMTREIQLIDNQTKGFAVPISDLRKK